MNQTLDVFLTSLGLLIQCCGTILSFIVLIFLVLDLNLTKRFSEGQNSMQIIEFLQDDDTRAARETVIKELVNKDYSKWTSEDLWAADKACSTYDIAAIIIRSGIVKSDIFFDNWAFSIKKCYRILEPHLKERQRTAGDYYWNDFKWLYKKAISQHPD